MFFRKGIKYNLSLATGDIDFGKIISLYLEQLNSFQSVRIRTLDGSSISRSPVVVAGGVYAFTVGQQLKLLAPGSASRGIPFKAWGIKIPISTNSGGGYCFCPSANVIAFGETLPCVPK